jgi:hypothetical protein
MNMARIRVILASISISILLILLLNGLMTISEPGISPIGIRNITNATQYTILNPNSSVALSYHEYLDETASVIAFILEETPPGGTDTFTVGDHVPGGYEGYAIISSDMPISITIDTGPADFLEAGFEAGPVIGSAPQTVVFTNTSSGHDTSLWSFGDGMTSPLPSPTHTYTMPGSYTATLTVSLTGCFLNQPHYNPTASAVIQIKGFPESDVFMPAVLAP